MRRSSHPALLILACAVGLACSDRSFREVDETGGEHDDTGSEGRAPSPWDGLDGLDRPEALFAGLWHDRDTLDLRAERWRCRLGETGPARHGFFDLDGRLLLELDPPEPDWLPVPDPLTGSTEATPLSPAGPGRVLVVSAEPALDTEVETAGPTRHAWLADGTAEQTERWLTWQARGPGQATGPGTLTLVPSGQVLDLGQEIVDLRIAADPTVDRRVWVAPVYAQAAPDAPALLRLSVDDVTTVTGWSARELLEDHPHKPEVDGYVPGSLRVERDAGRTRVTINLIGVQVEADGPRIGGPAIVTVLDPISQVVVWTQEVSYGPLGPGAIDLDAEGDPAWLSTAYTDGDGAVVGLIDFVHRAPEVLEVRPPAGHTYGCPRTLDLLDADAGTALFHAVPLTEDTAGASVLTVVHRGEPVLVLPGLREGLGTTEVFFHDVVVLDGL